MIGMGRSSRYEAERARRRILGYLEARAVDDALACPLPRKMLAEHLGLSKNQVRYACRTLEAEGLIVCRRLYDDEGGQLGNGYDLSPSARRLLASIRRAS